MKPRDAKYSSLLCATAVMDGYSLQQLPEEDARRYSHNHLAQSMAYEIVERFPLEIELEEKCGITGISDERHMLKLYVFTPKDMEAFIKDIRKEVLIELAAARCLSALTEAPCH